MVSPSTIGQLVWPKADPARQGPVIEILPDVAGVQRRRVLRSPTERWVCDGTQNRLRSRGVKREGPSILEEVHW